MWNVVEKVFSERESDELSEAFSRIQKAAEIIHIKDNNRNRRIKHEIFREIKEFIERKELMAEEMRV